MNILFLHRNFPAQFRHIATHLAKDKNNKIVFITNNDKPIQLPNVTKITYKTKREVPNNCHRYLKFYEDSIIHGQAAAEAALQLKNQGFKPDVIYGHTWGPTLFMKDIFPDVPLINYFEWFYNAEDSDVDFDRKTPLNEDERARIRAKNAHLLIDLQSCDKGISPTIWQRDQFPKEFHNKIEVLHEGVDTNYFVPNSEAKLKIPNTNIELNASDEIITYATRGMESYRGFPQFMEAVEVLLKKRPNLQVVVGGEDRVCYGPQLPKGQSFKKIMLEKLDLDESRVHFTGGLPYMDYLKLLQISSCHVYLTYPFVLSWSLLEAMSTGCAIVASDTKPVLEVIKDNENGILTDFFDKNTLVEKIEDVLDNQDKVHEIRNNARETVVNNYNQQELLIKQENMIKNRLIYK